MSIVDLMSRLQGLNIRVWAEGERLRFSAPTGAMTPELRAELSAHKAAILAFLQKAEAVNVGSGPPLVPVRRDQALPLSFAQQRFWFLDQLEPQSAAYVMPVALRLDGPLDVAVLERSFQALLARHEALRTSFGVADGQPVQQIAPELSVPLRQIDLTTLSAAERGAAREGELLRAARTPFDLGQAPLMRALLLREAAERYTLLLTMPHIIGDGWSVGVLLRDLSALYDAAVGGGDAALPALPVQYADYALWQRQWLQGAVLEQQLRYWKEQLAGAPPVLKLPIDYPRPAIRRSEGQHHTERVPLSVLHNLQALGQGSGATLFMTVLAAFKVLLARLTQQSDLVVGTPIAGRTRAEVENVVGCFINTLALRTDLSGDPSFREVLGRVQQVTQAAFAHQDLPLEQAIDALRIERDVNVPPLVQVLFVFQNGPLALGEMGGVQFSQLPLMNDTAKFDLTLLVDVLPDGMETTIEYNRDLFAPSTIVRMTRQLTTLLSAVAASPAAPISALTLLTAAERQQLLREWNATAVTYPPAPSLHELVAAQAARTPEAIALVCEGQALRYRELDERANQLAHALTARGVGEHPLRETLVGICVERSLELVVGLLGILKAGGAYVPLDPSYPAERLQYMIADSGVPLVLTQHALLGTLPPDTQALCLDADWPAIAQQPTTPPAITIHPDQLAYMIYTSGSTGRPKGALNTHGAICNRLLWMQAEYGLTAEDRVLQKTPMSFDVSVWEFFWPLLTGARLVLARPEGHKDPSYLAALIQQEAVTTLHFVPSMLQVFVEEPAATGCRSIRRVICSGEALPYDLQQRVFARLPWVELHNLYGPTEAAVDVTYWACERASQRQSVPIGRPVANTQIYLLDAQLQPVPVGVAGELYIGGVQLARGYHGRPGLTAERFVPDPFAQGSSARTGGRLYRTGDLARYDADGVIEYLGRNDHQVKLRGFRIELGEIENALASQPGVAQAVVLARTDDTGDQRLVAYVVPEAGAQPARAELRAALSEQLPAYMVPSAFVLLDALPLTPNGKLDRAALPAPDADQTTQRSVMVAPRSGLEATLAAIWADVLRLEQVSVESNFFELGGHSLLATQVIARVRAALAVDVSLRTLFAAPTVAQFAAQLAAIEPALTQAAPPLAPARRDQALPLSFAQQRFWFLDELDPQSTAYLMPLALRLDGALDVAALERSLQALVARHEALRTSFGVVDGQPVQQIVPELVVPLRQIDLTPLPAGDQPAAREGELLRAARTPFDLGQAPLVRALLLREAAERYTLLLTMPHIIGDGWSIDVLLRDLSALYAAAVSGGDAALPALPVQYADYALWQRQWLQGAVLEQQLRYWKEQLVGAPSILALPTDYPRPPIQSYRGAAHTELLPPQLLSALQMLSQQAEATLFMTVLAVFKVLLARLTQQSDLVVGTPIAGRTRAEVEHVVGCFINTLALRTDLSGDPSFTEVLARVREVCLGAYAHEDAPFEQVIDALRIERDVSRPPLVQALFILRPTPAASIELPGLRISQDTIATNTTKFDLSFEVAVLPDGLHATIEYNRDLFAPETAARMMRQFTTLLGGIAADPAAPISALPLLSAAERQQLLYDWNATQAPRPADATIVTLFEAQAARTPDAIALVYEEQALSYAELNARANQLAHQLRTLGIGPERVVGLCLERSPELLVACLAVLKAGGAYLPFEATQITSRMVMILTDARAALLITQTELEPGLPAHSVATLCLDAIGPQLAQQPRTNPSSSIQPANLAYLLFTSGSTGLPKGVAVEHRQLLNYVLSVSQQLALPAGASYASVSSFSTDLGNTTIFASLSSGGCLHLIAQELLANPDAYAEYCQQHAIDCLKIVPSHLQALLSAAEPRAVLPRQRLVLGGESSSWELIERVQTLASHCQILNHYGPTETTVGATTFPLTAQTVRDSASVPIGRPLTNVRVYVLDAQLQPVPVGVAGELYIGGDGVARGYLHAPDLTAERFVPDPFATAPGERLYRTGDLVRYRPSGAIEFLGRSDGQIKLRGYRIEPGEIAAALERHSAVERCAVVLREDVPGDPRLVAYVVGREPRTDALRANPEPTAEEAGARLAQRSPALGSPAELRTFLQQHLPGYMIPSAFVALDALPLTPNGKLDQRALPAPEPSDQPVDAGHGLPRTVVELQLVRLWEELLRQPVGIYDNFFELGGHSLQTIQLNTRIFQLFGVKLPLSALFQNGTVAQIAQLLDQQAEAAAWSPLVPLQQAGTRPPCFFVHPVAGLVMAYVDLARQLGPDQPFYALQASGLEEGQPLWRDIPTMAAHYIAAIRSVQPEGPYTLGGWSFGGIAAYEIAQQLTAQGQSVEQLILLEPSPPHEPRPAEIVDDASYWLWRYGADLDLTLEQLRALPADAQPIKVLELLQAADKMPGYYIKRLDLQGAARMFWVEQANVQAAWAYQPQPYDGQVVILRATEQVDDETYDPLVAWLPLLKRAPEVYDVPGTHHTLLSSPNLEVAASVIRQCLEQSLEDSLAH